jgi:hypothetical protein
MEIGVAWRIESSFSHGGMKAKSERKLISKSSKAAKSRKWQWRKRIENGMAINKRIVMASAKAA